MLAVRIGHFYGYIHAGNIDILGTETIGNVWLDGDGGECGSEVVLHKGEVVVAQQVPEEVQVFDADEAEGFALQRVHSYYLRHIEQKKL